MKIQWPESITVIFCQERDGKIWDDNFVVIFSFCVILVTERVPNELDLFGNVGLRDLQRSILVPIAL